MSRSSQPSALATPPAAGRTRGRLGFTLIELLVVVGIIVVLLSILLPTIGAARRQGRTAKCLAHLHQIGQGFRAYASDHEGAWPVAIHHSSSTYMPLGPGVPERRWYDLLGPYVAGNRVRTKTYADVKRMRLDSVVWGCPEYTKTLDLRTSDPDSPHPSPDEARPGYGMNYHNTFYEDGGRFSDLAYIDNRGTPINGRYIRMEQWKPGNRILVADSPAHVLQSPPTLTRNSRWMPYDAPFRQGDFFVEVRHGKPGMGTTTEHKAMSYTNPCISALFVDGSASLISVREAWMAHRNPANIPTDKGGAAPPPL